MLRRRNHAGSRGSISTTAAEEQSKTCVNCQPMARRGFGRPIEALISLEIHLRFTWIRIQPDDSVGRVWMRPSLAFDWR